MSAKPAFHDGGCGCRLVRYRMTTTPLFVHIFTASQQPWVVLAPDIPAVAEYYRASELWPRESLERRRALLARSRQP